MTQAAEACSRLREPLAIGRVVVKPRTALAPMADLTDFCLRGLLKEERMDGGELALGLVVNEFVASRALVRGDRRLRHLLRSDPRERPLSMQIYGSDPAEMADAARIAADAGADILDINMGCPVSTVTGHGSGAALLKDPPRARAMVQAVRAATDVPVTVKMRAGWCEGSCDPVTFARGLEDAGAAMIAVHPRTREQGYSGRARWEVIGAIKAAVGVPVLGNGDVRSAQDAWSMVTSTGCDGVMVGRGALKNPRIFCEILDDTGASSGEPEERFERRLAFACRYAAALLVVVPPSMALHRFKKLVGLVLRGEPGAVPILRGLESQATVEELMRFVQGFLRRPGGGAPYGFREISSPAWRETEPMNEAWSPGTAGPVL